MSKKELIDLLLERLPDGTVLDDDFLDKISGGKSLDALAKGLALADKNLIPQRFASLADLANWAENSLGFAFRSGDGLAKNDLAGESKPKQ